MLVRNYLLDRFMEHKDRVRGGKEISRGVTPLVEKKKKKDVRFKSMSSLRRSFSRNFKKYRNMQGL